MHFNEIVDISLIKLVPCKPTNNIRTVPDMHCTEGLFLGLINKKSYMIIKAKLLRKAWYNKH